MPRATLTRRTPGRRAVGGAEVVDGAAAEDGRRGRCRRLPTSPCPRCTRCRRGRLPRRRAPRHVAGQRRGGTAWLRLPRTTIDQAERPTGMETSGPSARPRATVRAAGTGCHATATFTWDRERDGQRRAHTASSSTPRLTVDRLAPYPVVGAPCPSCLPPVRPPAGCPSRPPPCWPRPRYGRLRRKRLDGRLDTGTSGSAGRHDRLPQPRPPARRPGEQQHLRRRDAPAPPASGSAQSASVAG